MGLGELGFVEVEGVLVLADDFLAVEGGGGLGLFFGEGAAAHEDAAGARGIVGGIR